MENSDPEDRLRQLFQQCDLDGSGFIDKAELASICSELSGQDLTNVFRQLDQDGDGKISIEEFAKGYRNIVLARDSKTRELMRQRLRSDKSEDLVEDDDPTVEEFVGGLDDGLNALSW